MTMEMPKAEFDAFIKEMAAKWAKEDEELIKLMTAQVNRYPDAADKFDAFIASHKK